MVCNLPDEVEPTMTSHAVLQLRSDLCRGVAQDHMFDRLYPQSLRAKSAMYWTPLRVARRAAELFASHKAKRVLDVGSGAGKFCLAAASSRPDLELIGVEQRSHLVDLASEAAGRLHLRNAHFR